MFRRVIIDFLNHLLRTEGWSLARLKPFAGQHARFEFGPFAQSFVVAGDGSLSRSTEGATATVTIRLPDDAPFRLLANRNALFGSARIAGSADFAEALGFVARNLRWDAEADLARIVGDIPAHRLTGIGRRIVGDGADRLARLNANFSEFVTDGEGPLATAPEAARFAQDVAALREALGRLEERVSRLYP